MPALSTNSRIWGRSFFISSAARFQSSSVEVAGSMPMLDHGRWSGSRSSSLEHGDLALEGRVGEVLEAGDLALGQLGVVGQPDQARLPGQGVLVARVVARVLDRRGGVLGEVGQLGVVELGQEVLADQLVDRGAVGDHDQVPAGVLAGLERGVDLAQEGVVLVDDLFVVDLDPRLLGELLERGVHGLAALLLLVHVQRPVGEVELAGLGLAGPEPGRLGGVVAARPLDAAGGEEGGGAEQAGAPEGVAAADPRHGHPAQPRGVERSVPGHGRVSSLVPPPST